MPSQAAGEKGSSSITSRLYAPSATFHLMATVDVHIHNLEFILMASQSAAPITVLKVILDRSVHRARDHARADDHQLHMLDYVFNNRQRATLQLESSQHAGGAPQQAES